MQKDAQKKTIPFREAGRLMYRSLDLRFLYRMDVMLLLGGTLITNALIDLFDAEDLPFPRQIYKALGITGHVILPGLSLLSVWFLTFTVTRASLTSRRGIALWRLDRGALQSIGIVALPVLIACLAELAIEDLLGEPMATALNGGGLYLYGAISLGWLWLTVRCVTMSAVAWESGNAGFSIGRSYEAMRGHVWSYIVWDIVISLPFILVISLVNHTAIFAVPGSHPSGMSVGILTLNYGVHQIMLRSFDLQFFRALGLDRPVR